MSRSSSLLAEAGVVIPVRSFVRGKSRLAGTLDADAHEAFVRELAGRAADAARGHPTVVVTDAPEVLAWADTRGMSTIPDRGSLDAAAHDGRAWVAERGCTRVVVVHADLPDITSLAAVAGDGATPVAVIVPCHRDDGTPVLSLPVAAPFDFAYGPGSFERHVATARAAGLDVRIVQDPALRFDVDGPDDLAAVLDRRPAAR
ncbi:MAG TPA: 2-phospho-L-lactate guanylyltransferase [Acidimicrobiia bacterium]|jgi:2-phospho-L-lactate guanylyltransferase|nr:2-phospho-L-lactate guanylyltransferase [Acidimicrobiia bacterium]